MTRFYARANKRIYRGVPSAQEPLAEGHVRCVCGKSVSLTPNGHIRKHKDSDGFDCAHQASYQHIQIDDLPPVTFDPPRRDWAKRGQR